MWKPLTLGAQGRDTSPERACYPEDFSRMKARRQRREEGWETGEVILQDIEQGQEDVAVPDPGAQT